MSGSVSERSRYPVAPYQYYAWTGSGHTPSRGTDEYWQDCDIPWVTTADVKHLRDGRRQVLEDTEFHISELGLANSAARLRPAGTVVLSRTASVGFSAIMGQPMATSQDFVTWTPGPGLDSRYLLWALRAMKASGDFDRLMYGSTHKTIYVPDLQQLRGPVPAVDAQRRIADYLDGQTTHIDRLIADANQLLELAGERRLAEVVDLVAGGPSPRQVGIYGSSYWLGSLPETWDVVPLGYRYQVQLGKMLNPERSRTGTQRPYLGNANVRWDGFDLTNLSTMDFAASEWIRYGVAVGDVLVCEGGEVGRAAVWNDSSREVYYQKALHRLRPLAPDREVPRFLMYALMAAAKTGVFEAGSNKATIDHLTGEKLAEHRFPFPPHSEQRRIVEKLDASGDRLTRLEASTNRRVALLKERRRALVTAAVTGELEV